MDKQRLEEFLKQHCVKAYRDGRLAPNRLNQDDGDGPHWRSKTYPDRQNLVIRNGRIVEVEKFSGIRPYPVSRFSK